MNERKNEREQKVFAIPLDIYILVVYNTFTYTLYILRFRVV